MAMMMMMIVEVHSCFQIIFSLRHFSIFESRPSSISENQNDAQLDPVLDDNVTDDSVIDDSVIGDNDIDKAMTLFPKMKCTWRRSEQKEKDGVGRAVFCCSR